MSAGRYMTGCTSAAAVSVTRLPEPQSREWQQTCECACSKTPIGPSWQM